VAEIGYHAMKRGDGDVVAGLMATRCRPAMAAVTPQSTAGRNAPQRGRPAQPCELAAAYVMLAGDDASYVSGATIAVTGGKPIL
jgi:NAD(P)-dependent dehydrogenase (short-subunit alcohol dehydrogenase family)